MTGDSAAERALRSVAMVAWHPDSFADRPPGVGGGVCYKERGGGERNHRGPAQIRTGDLILSGCLEKTGKVNKSSGGIKNNPTVLQYCRGAALCFC